MKLASEIRVFFNASVILAGFHSPAGGSGKLLSWVKQKRVIGIVSEIIYNEVMRNVDRIQAEKKQVADFLNAYFLISAAPPKDDFQKYTSFIMDEDDIHVFVSAEKTNCDVLVSLDKKHILALKNKIRSFRIMSPKELILQLDNV